MTAIRTDIATTGSVSATPDTLAMIVNSRQVA